MLSVFFGSLVGFACGAIFGIADCKKTFGIPTKAKPEDGEWLVYGVDDGNECTG